jgi:integrase
MSPASLAPPKVEEEEIEILTEDEINIVLDKLVGHPLYEIAVVDLNTGMRRGELLALRLSDIDLDGATEMPTRCCSASWMARRGDLTN